MLIFVIAGGLTLTQCPQSGPIAQDASKAGGEKMDNHTVTIYPGDVVGGLAVLTGECSLYTIRAKHNSRVGLLNKDVIYRYVCSYVLRAKDSSCGRLYCSYNVCAKWNNWFQDCKCDAYMHLTQWKKSS